MMMVVSPRHRRPDDGIASPPVDSPIQTDTRVMPVRQ